jgi:hypothetical protein
MKKLPLLILIVIIAFAACSKGPGTGGRASIEGKVWATNLTANLSVIIDSGYVGATKVYITYGDNVGVSDNVETAYDGSYKFGYLRSGNYKVWTYSKAFLGAAQLDTFVLKDVTISSNTETKKLEDLRIYTNKN